MKRENKEGLNFTLKVLKRGKIAQRYESSHLRRFCAVVKALSFKKHDIKVHLRVSYGRHLDNFGKMVEFWNDGVYDTRKDFLLAFNAFREL